MKRNCEIRSHGLRLLLSNHKRVRNLKKSYIPSDHGNKVWPTAWLLIDYFKKNNPAYGQKILEIACGWGLSGIYCAKAFNSKVFCIDGDEEVYPYLKLMAEINKVKIDFRYMEINEIRYNLLGNIDIIIGSDICYSDTLVDSIRRLINRAKKASVAQIYISDPGRWPFDELTNLFIGKVGAELIDWEITRPFNVRGKIFKYEL